MPARLLGGGVVEGAKKFDATPAGAAAKPATLNMKIGPVL
jgi:hypothetical protein